jgi:predicted nucleotide-binding protein
MRAFKLSSSEQRISNYFLDAGLSDTQAAVYTLMLGRGYCDRRERLIGDLEYFFPPQRARRRLLGRALDALVARRLVKRASRSKIATLEVVRPWTSAVVRSLPTIVEVDRAVSEAVAHQQSQTLVTALGPATAKAGREQFRELVRRATQEIRLGVYSSKTAYPEIKDLVRDKLLHGGVRIRILMLSPDLAASLERDNTLRHDVLERTNDWRALAAAVQAQRSDHCADLELRWLRDANLVAFRRVMLVDERSWMLTVHRSGQRGVEGLVQTGTGEGGETNLYCILDHYWKSAWTRAVNPFDKTRLFIGSSTKGLGIARALAALLQQTGMVQVTVWNEHFKASRFTLEELFRAVHESEFAVLVLTADDEKIVRGVKTQAPRDNVIFELGMFMTRIGRERAMFVCEETGRTGQSGLELPTDLAGVAALKFRVLRTGTDRQRQAALRNASDQIAARIREFRRDFPEPAVVVGRAIGRVKRPSRRTG